SAISPGTVELIITLRKELSGQGLDAGPHTIAWHLQHHHQRKVSAVTVSRTLSRQGLVVPDPSKRPRPSYIRFAAELPNECWQSAVPRGRGRGRPHTGTPLGVGRPPPPPPAVPPPRRAPGPGRARRVRAPRGAARRPRLDPDGQRHGLPHPPVGRQGRPQRPG